MHSFAPHTLLALIIVCGYFIFYSEGIICYNCLYKEYDPLTHFCLHPTNLTAVNCSRDGTVQGKAGIRDKNDKCSYANGTHPIHGRVIFRTCSRGETMCKTLKEREQYLLTKKNQLIKLFFLIARHCNCDEKDLCNNVSPPNGTLPYNPVVASHDSLSLDKLDFDSLSNPSNFEGVVRVLSSRSGRIVPDSVCSTGLTIILMIVNFGCVVIGVE